MPIVPSIDLERLLTNVPRGAWVAISSTYDRVIAFGPDLGSVMAEARANGEHDPLMTRVPEVSRSLTL